MDNHKLNLLLADDDTDDCVLFEEALKELSIPVTLRTVHDGATLMQLLSEASAYFPDILFLDLNMPRKTGIECLSEIKGDDRMKHLPVVIFSTFMDLKTADMIHTKGAHYYVQKPAGFSPLKHTIQKALRLTLASPEQQPEKENFILDIG